MRSPALTVLYIIAFNTILGIYIYMRSPTLTFLYIIAFNTILGIYIYIYEVPNPHCPLHHHIQHHPSII